MTKENARKYMPLVQALADGKKIQCNYRGEWFDVESISTETYGPHEYRIKPEPRTFEMWLSSGGLMYPWEAFPSAQPGMEHITVQEVLK